MKKKEDRLICRKKIRQKKKRKRKWNTNKKTDSEKRGPRKE